MSHHFITSVYLAFVLLFGARLILYLVATRAGRNLAIGEQRDLFWFKIGRKTTFAIGVCRESKTRLAFYTATITYPS